MGQTADDLSQTETRDVTGDDPEEIREEIAGDELEAPAAKRAAG